VKTCCNTYLSIQINSLDHVKLALQYGSSILSNYKGLTREIGLEPPGHRPSIPLTLVLFLRVEVAATVKNEGGFGE